MPVRERRPRCLEGAVSHWTQGGGGSKCDAPGKGHQPPLGECLPANFSTGHDFHLTEKSLFSCSVMSNSVTPWTVACQAPLSMGFPRQEYWSGLPFSPPGDLPDPGIKPASPALAGDFFTTQPSGKPQYQLGKCKLRPVRLFATPWTVAYQAPLSMEFSRQEYSSGLPRPPPGDLPDPRIEPASLSSAALTGKFLNAPNKRRRLTGWMRMCVYALPLATSVCLSPQTAMPHSL